MQSEIEQLADSECCESESNGTRSRNVWNTYDMLPKLTFAHGLVDLIPELFHSRR